VGLVARFIESAVLWVIPGVFVNHDVSWCSGALVPRLALEFSRATSCTGAPEVVGPGCYAASQLLSAAILDDVASLAQPSDI
jgi:hypothetical protein